jgi:hypothetical protein
MAWEIVGRRRLSAERILDGQRREASATIYPFPEIITREGVFESTSR